MIVMLIRMRCVSATCTGKRLPDLCGRRPTSHIRLYAVASCPPNKRRNHTYRYTYLHNCDDAVQHRHFASTMGTVETSDSEPEEVEPKEQSVEDQYSRKTPLEHVLLRPGMYVGPNERLPPAPCWVLDTPPPPPALEGSTSAPVPGEESNMRMTKKVYGLVPALCKVFDEILVNASDNRLRHPKSCSRIDVVIDPGAQDRDPFISVFNDGKGIPIQIHRKEGMYVPEMLFGHLLTGSNFDDDKKRLTGGRHGYGAKLANIFSKSFTVETASAKKKLKYRQTWSSNMSLMEEPIIEKVRSGGTLEDYTKVEFVPDLPRLTGEPDAHRMAPEDYAFICRRVVDVAGCATGLTVTLNGRDVSMKSFADYGKMYRSLHAPMVYFQRLNARWTVGVGLSESGSFEAISFVNGMATTRGGTHVDVLLQQITKMLQETIEKRNPTLGPFISPSQLKRQLFVCVDAQIENPSFDSQMKEYLTSSPSNFGSSYTLKASFLNRIAASEEEGGPGIVEEMLRVAKERQQQTLLKKVSGKKSRKQLLSIPKLDDAHQAGARSGWDCTLILTEGDSAKALAVAGLEVVGRDRFGVFPLRGKFLNVREAPIAQLSSNAEVKALVAILGLDFKKSYVTVEDRRQLRYGRVMLMTDQDTDGSHIKGLIINFFRNFWPELLLPPSDIPPEEALIDPPFLASFVTPLLKVTKIGKEKDSLAFYSMAEYNAWRRSVEPEDMKAFTIKYYKGLGTSTSAEAKAYFSAFDNNLRPFRWNSDADGEKIDMVFDKKRASDRRNWITDVFDPDATAIVDPLDGNSVTYEDFVDKEMIHFSHADNIRSIPSVIDGLKPSQRKVMYACFKRKLKSEIKVAQLTGYCAEHTAYHHGEASLQSTIIGMAQDFVGSNNINLLEPSGSFGTRLAGGSDAASPRYIFTQLAPIARHIFPEVDDVLLTYREDDGQRIEPEFYCPIIPMLLVNGSQGIGTGWSTMIPPHNPVDVLNYIRAKLDDVPDLPSIRPFVRGFDGTMEIKKDGSGYVSVGRVSKQSNTSLLISELPAKVWTNKYKEHLLKMREKGLISGFLENHTTTKVSFTVNMKDEQLQAMEKKGLESVFKLRSNHLISNMYAFDSDLKMTKYSSPEDIVDAFFPMRMELYRDRKSVLESEANFNAMLLRNKARFIEAVTQGKIDLMTGRKSEKQTATKLEELGFAKLRDLQAVRNDNAVFKRQQIELLETTEDKGSVVGKSSEFDYLINMPISSLTLENIEALNSEATSKDKELEMIQNTSASDLWRQDLDKLALIL